MPGTTSNLNLYLPDLGENDVADELNQNAQTIDGRFDPASGHTHDGTAGNGPPIPVTSIAAVGVPSADNYLRGDGQWASGAGGGEGVSDHGELTGLTDDDHPQYHTQGRGDTRWAQRANNLSDLGNAATARTNLGAAATVHTHAAADLTSGTIATARLGTGTASAQTYLRGDQTWGTVDPGVSGSGLWSWKSAVMTGDPGVNAVGVNHDLPASATMMYLNKFAPNSVDYSGLLSALRDGDTIFLQQGDDSASWHRYEVTGTPTVSGAAFAIPVTTLGGSAQGTEPINNKRVYLIINNAPASSTALSTEDVQDIVNTLLVAGTGITKTYDDTANTLTLAASGGGGAVATDPIWDAAGDLAVGSGANTAARLALGASGTVLTSTGSAAAWQAPAGGASAVGLLPYVYPPLYDPRFTQLLAVFIDNAGGALMLPFEINGNLLLDSITLRNQDTSGLRTMEWRLYREPAGGSGTLDHIPGLNGTDSFTAATTSNRTSAAVSPTTIGPGLYWLCIRNTEPTNDWGTGGYPTSPGEGAMGRNLIQVKNGIGALGATLDAATGWSKGTHVIGCRLNGRVFGQSSSF